MMIHIITLHSIYNPGSALQAFGLQKFLETEGYDTEIIDYRPRYSTVGRNKMKGYLRKLLFHNNEVKVKRKYEGFMSEKMKLSQVTYKTFNELKQAYRNNDIFIAGSDQLWNADYDCGKDDAYYLDFTDSTRKIAYATSVGKKSVSEEEIQRIIKSIKSFSTITVREKSTAELLSNRLGEKVTWVCDPVFLLDKDLYDNMTKKMINNRYAVVYLSSESDLLNNVVEDISKKTGCKIVLIGGNRTRCKCDLHVRDLGPYDFLSLIKYSEIVISSSFHATAFAHIFHKKFGVILPKVNGERIESLLELTRLTDRILTDSQSVLSVYKEIDYSKVDMALGRYIDESKKVLLDGVGNLQDGN